jgi:hypothetical protein
MALLGSAWRAYNAALVARPLPTKVASGVAIYMIGDTSAQRVESYARNQERLSADPRVEPEAFRWNRWRTLRMCLYGGVWMSPFLHVWYRSLDAMLVGRALFAGRAPLLAAAKLALDQSFAATTNMTAFYTINGLMEGQSPLQVRDTLRERKFSALPLFRPLRRPLLGHAPCRHANSAARRIRGLERRTLSDDAQPLVRLGACASHQFDTRPTTQPRARSQHRWRRMVDVHVVVWKPAR